MDKPCDKLKVERYKEFIDVGERPLTMLERWAIDNAQLDEIAAMKSANKR
jgi:hypothetical protein